MTRSTFGELKRGLSILRAETVVALSRLELEIPENALVLDAGGPTFALEDAVGSSREFRTVALNLNRARKPDVVCDLDMAWPIASEAADVVCSSYVLEHLYQPARFFSESQRCLKAKGRLLLTTVFSHPKHGSPRDFFRFTDDALVRLAADAGLDARAIPLLSGPLQSAVAALSPFFLFFPLRALALAIAKGVDPLLKRFLPFVRDNWCVGYAVVAVKR